MAMMMRGKRKTTCNEGRGKEVGDTEEDEVIVGAETRPMRRRGTRGSIELLLRWARLRGFDIGDEAGRTLLLSRL